MPVEERRRVQLRNVVAAAWGEEAADTLFELMTPAGQDLATRQDVDGLRRVTEDGFHRVDQRLDALESRMDRFESSVGDRLDRFESGVGERLGRFESGVGTLMGLLEIRMDERLGRFESGVGTQLVALEARMDERGQARLDAMEHRLLERFERRIADAVTSQTRTLVFSQLGALLAMAAIAFGLR